MKVAEKNGPGYDNAEPAASDSKDPMYHKRASLDDADPMERGDAKAPPQIKPMGPR